MVGKLEMTLRLDGYSANGPESRVASGSAWGVGRVRFLSSGLRLSCRLFLTVGKVESEGTSGRPPATSWPNCGESWLLTGGSVLAILDSQAVLSQSPRCIEIGGVMPFVVLAPPF
ncbi:hypothetical protein [Rhodanobacter sp. 115]|uniref:hypothetical protein n=1 Tax=Rhodanobacter sp. FW021-MT20 TaxID=1162282 RepID=UPI00178C518A|nr:hypothetical protein [Rhodanobacter sp. 115]